MLSRRFRFFGKKILLSLRSIGSDLLPMLGPLSKVFGSLVAYSLSSYLSHRLFVVITLRINAQLLEVVEEHLPWQTQDNIIYNLKSTMVSIAGYLLLLTTMILVFTFAENLEITEHGRG